MEKMTKREMFAMVMAIVNGEKEITEEVRESVVNFCEHETSLLAKKAGSKGMTKAQKENELLKVAIFDVLVANDGPMTVGEIMKNLEGDYSSQKISALVSKMKGINVDRTEVKGVAYFSPIVRPEIVGE